MKSELTSFGTECRKLRQSREMIIGDQALELGISASMISKIENGRQDLPDGYIEKFSLWLNLNEKETYQLENAAKSYFCKKC